MIGLTRYGLRPPRLLLSGCAIAAALILGEIIFPRLGSHNAPPPVPPPAPAAAAAVPAVAPSAPIDAYGEIATRPLFEPSRRPAPPDQAPSGPPPARPTVVVLGIAMTGGNRYAVVRHGNPPKVEQVIEGQTIDGWQIQAIASDRITLRSGADTVDVLLGTGARSGPTATTPGRSAPPLSKSFGGGPDL